MSDSFVSMKFLKTMYNITWRAFLSVLAAAPLLGCAGLPVSDRRTACLYTHAGGGLSIIGNEIPGHFPVPVKGMKVQVAVSPFPVITQDTGGALPWVSPFQPDKLQRLCGSMHVYVHAGS